MGTKGLLRLRCIRPRRSQTQILFYSLSPIIFPISYFYSPISNESCLARLTLPLILVSNKYFPVFFLTMLQLKSLKLFYVLNVHSYTTIYYMQTLLSAFFVVSEHLNDICVVNDWGRHLGSCNLWFIYYIVMEILCSVQVLIFSRLQSRLSVRNARKRFDVAMSKWIWREGFAGQLQKRAKDVKAVCREMVQWFVWVREFSFWS